MENAKEASGKKKKKSVMPIRSDVQEKHDVDH